MPDIAALDRRLARPRLDGEPARLLGRLAQPPRQRRRQRPRRQLPAPVPRRRPACSSAPRCPARARPAPGPSRRAPARRRPGGSAPTTARARAIPRAANSASTSSRGRSRQRLVPAARGVVVVGAGVDDLVLGVVARAGAAPSGSRGSKPNCSTTIPGSPSASRRRSTAGRDHAEVLGDQRQRAPARARAASNTRAAPGRAASDRIAQSRASRGHRPVGHEAAEVVDPREVEQLEGAPQALDPPAVAAALQRRPVVERVAPQLALVGVGVGRRAGHRAVAGRARGARGGRRCPARRRSATSPISRTPRSLRVRAQRAPLALEAHLVGDRAARRRAAPSPRSSSRCARGSRRAPTRGHRRARVRPAAPARRRTPTRDL